MLLLANMEKYDDAILKAVQHRQATGMSAEAMKAYRDEEVTKYGIVNGSGIINVTGPLNYKADFWSYYFGGCSYQGLQAKIKDAEANDAVSRVILYVDTPGGDVVGCNETAKIVKDCAKEVVAVVDPCCASAGLWLASQADRIVCIESGEVGSLGVQGVRRSYAEQLKKAGVDVTIFRAAISPDKNLGHPYEAMTDEARVEFQARVDRMGEKFVASVAEGRGVDRGTVLAKFGKGRMLDAEEALRVGLIDGIGTLQSVLAEGKTKTAASTIKRRAISMRDRRY